MTILVVCRILYVKFICRNYKDEKEISFEYHISFTHIKFNLWKSIVIYCYISSYILRDKGKNNNNNGKIHYLDSGKVIAGD